MPPDLLAKVFPEFNILSPECTVEVGDYVADILADDQIIVELKAIKALDNIHRAQCLNYLKATGFKVCLLVNFGNPKLEVRRIVLDY